MDVHQYVPPEGEEDTDDWSTSIQRATKEDHIEKRNQISDHPFMQWQGDENQRIGQRWSGDHGV
jgi:hypothetical protein